MNAKIFSYPLTVKESYIDSFSHVNNAAPDATNEEIMQRGIL